MPSSCPPLVPFTQTCAGHGECVQNFTTVTNNTQDAGCMCEDGWYSSGDFVFTPNVQCDIYGPAIQALWGTTGLAAAFAACTCLVLLLRLADLPARAVSRTLYACLISQCASSVFNAVTGALKASASNPGDRAIGVDVLTTLFFFAAYICTWMGFGFMIFYLFQVFASMSGWPQAEQRRFILSHIWLVIVWILGYLSASIGIVVPLLASGPQGGFAGACMHFVGSSIVILASATGAVQLTRNVEAQVDTALHLSSGEVAGKFSTLKRKLQRFRSTITTQAPSQVLMALLFGVWAGVQRLSSYEIAIAWGPVYGFILPAFCYLSWPSTSQGRRKLASNMNNQVANQDDQPHSVEITRTTFAGGKRKFRRLVTIVELDEFIKDDEGGEAQVVNDSGSIVAIISEHRLTVSDDDVGICAVSGSLRAAQRARLDGLESLLGKRLVWLCVALASSATLAFVGLVLAEVIDQRLSVLLLVPTLFMVYVVSFTYSLAVLRRLMGTVFFCARLGVVLVSLVLVSLAVNGDARIVVLLLFTVVQLAAFAGDALVEQARPLRRTMVTLALLMSAELWLFLQFNLVSDYANVKIPCGIPGNNISLYQVARDAIFGDIFLLVFELEYLVRGKASKRFLHIGDAVWRRVIPFDDEHVDTSQQEVGARINAGASAMILQSGFFAVNQQMQASVIGEEVAENEALPGTTKKTLYVDCVLLKQSHCMACHIFGREKGEAIFRVLDGPLGSFATVFLNVSAFPVFVSLVLGFDPRICYIALAVSWLFVGGQPKP
jgi:hypothetical protein